MSSGEMQVEQMLALCSAVQGVAYLAVCTHWRAHVRFRTAWRAPTWREAHRALQTLAVGLYQTLMPGLSCSPSFELSGWSKLCYCNRALLCLHDLQLFGNSNRQPSQLRIALYRAQAPNRLHLFLVSCRF